MLIDKDTILMAKEKMGVEAASIIASDLGVQQWDDVSLKGCCIFHDENTPSFIWNAKTNCFHCFSCGKNYGIVDHYISHHGLTFLQAVERLFKETQIDYRFSERGVKSEKEYVYPKHVESLSREQVEHYLGRRRISKKTLDYVDVQQDEYQNIVFHYYDPNDVLMTVKYRVSHKAEKGDTKFWHQKGVGSAPLLYNMNRIDPTQPLIVCEGELDCLSVIESGYPNAVSIPNGAGDGKHSWVEYNWNWLEQFSEIIVWFDNDRAGSASRKEICSRLGTWRTKFVELPPELEKDGETIKIKDINEVLYYFGKDKVIEFIQGAQDVPVQNVVDLSTVDDFDIETTPGLFSCISGIDDIIYKFVFGSLVVLTGAKGSGKSTLLNQIFVCEPLNQGHDVFVFSGEMGNPVLRNWIETTMAGRENITMKNEFVRVIPPTAKREMREWYKGRVWSFDDTDNKSDTILDRAMSVTRRFGVKVWIIDNLMTLDIASDDWNAQKEFVVKLVNLAKTYGVLIVLVAHPRKTTEIRRLVADDVAGANSTGNMAHYILGVHRFTKKEKDGEREKSGKYKFGKEPVEEDASIDIFKNRYTGKIGEVKVFFDYPSYRFYQTPKELYKRFKWDTNPNPIPTKDPNKHSEQPDWVGG